MNHSINRTSGRSLRTFKERNVVSDFEEHGTENTFTLFELLKG